MRKSIDQIGIKWRIAPDTAYLPLCNQAVELDMFHNGFSYTRARFAPERYKIHVAVDGGLYIRYKRRTYYLNV